MRPPPLRGPTRSAAASPQNSARLMASIGWALLLFLVQLPMLATSSFHDDGNLTLSCHPDQAAALLQLKQSFFHTRSILPSWQIGTDCCFWEGVSCDAYSGLVTELDLNGRGLYSNGLDPALFSLQSLRRLDLSMNTLRDERYNTTAGEFERLTLLTHLNLSNSFLSGQIPMGIKRLINLVSLDLSSRAVTPDDDITTGIYSFNTLQEPNFQTLVANLSNLRELYLDELYIMPSSGEGWAKSLARSVPLLRVLSLRKCGLNSAIDNSLSSLRSLVALNLGSNNFPAGPVPEFFRDFLNLSVLQLSDMNLKGWFPQRLFHLKNLRILDVSFNPDLWGYFPIFSHANSLETLRLEGTNFFYAKPTSSSNLKSLKQLGLDGKFLSMDFLSLFGLLGSVRQLKINQMDSERDLGSILSWIGNLKNLKTLTLLECDFSLAMPSSIANLKALMSLTMFYCNLPRTILSAIGNLRDLQDLSMYGCTLHGSMTSSIGNLTNLRSLYMESCEACGPMPAAIGHLKMLRRLAVVDCEFAGAIPSAVGNLTNLKSMAIFSHFSGPIPYVIGQLKELTQLRIDFGGISGRIPSSIGNLTRLVRLSLFDNHLSGPIPAPLFALPELRFLNLGWNELSGHVEEFDAASSCLEAVMLTKNKLAGQLPESFFQLTSLFSLEIDSNSFVGSVDLSSFSRLRKLAILNLSHNKLSVTDEEGNNSSSYLSGLKDLGIACCNITKVPSILTRLNGMSYLDLSCNNIGGDIPKLIWERWSSSLLHLNLSHNIFTGMQLTSQVLPFSCSLEVLDLSYNRLQGQVPMPNASADILDYSHNNFSSILPNFTLYLGDTSYITMSNNSINGHIPHSVCDSRSLEIFDLSYNSFRGQIPHCLLEGRMAVLNLRENQFQGTFPSNITHGCALQTIDLNGNNVQGQLPRALYKCTDLEVLDLGNNQVVDTFPSWLGELPNLRVLVLRSNHFYGSLGGQLLGDHQSREYFSSLQIIDLASNNFSGNLSSEWFRRLKSMMDKFSSTGDIVLAHNVSRLYQDSVVITYKGSSVTFERILTTLTSIDFSNNRLEGTIPESVGQLVSLHVLNMSHNAFTGRIPSQLGVMTDLESLDLSCNQLSGEIPQELTDLTFLGTLNLSENQFEGKIPQACQFSTFDNSSFEGNLGLCGPPLSNPCGFSTTPPVHVENSSAVDVVLYLFVGLGFGVGFTAAILVRWDRMGEWFVESARALQT